MLQKIVVPTYMISGVVTKPDGSAATNVSVQLQTAPDNTLVGQSVKTEILSNVTVNNTNLAFQSIMLQAITTRGNAISIVYSGNDATVTNLPAQPSSKQSAAAMMHPIAPLSKPAVQLRSTAARFA
ncbi:hypothetical protein AGMMS50239_18100 [Bacteroidia bacterium]|nr:hypothetical protein AGMMS50239_18100 [Bacteroidia bacterium]